jgi:hypothetical protein
LAFAVGSSGFSSVDESVDPGTTDRVVPGTTYDGATPGVDTVAGAEYSTGVPVAIPGSQQSTARLLRVKTRDDTLLKNPQGPNNPLPSPQWLNGPD